jgi:nucleotide-binding universal stress UspA family protein
MNAQGKISLQDILAATDFSTQSYQAFEAARSLAELFGARLHVLYVVRETFEWAMAQNNLNRFAKNAGSVDITKAIAIGDPASELLKYADREKIDLIVMGTHGRHGLARVLMGSVAEAVVRDAPCQVLTIGPNVRVTEKTDAPAKVAPVAEGHCLVCASPSRETFCDSCKAHIQGEAIERKRREDKTGHRGLTT